MALIGHGVPRIGIAIGMLGLAAGVIRPQGVSSQQRAEGMSATGGRVVTTHARGTFEVKLTPEASDSGAVPARMTIDKRFHGDLEGTSQGQMLAAGTAVEGSAGYVAIERVTGSLAGRRGSFVLQHSGTMNRGTPELVITVVPDSGTEGLAGLTGRMAIIIEGRNHSYDFEYALPAE